MLYRGSPTEALQRASDVLSDYWEMVTTSDTPVDWGCQHEYTVFGSTTEPLSESPTQHFTGGTIDLEPAQVFGASEITHYVSSSTETYGRRSVKASQRRPSRDLYKLGFIIASICGGLLFVFTLYCLITQKVPAASVFVISQITCALIKFNHAFQSYCNKAVPWQPGCACMQQHQPALAAKCGAAQKKLEAGQHSYKRYVLFSVLAFEIISCDSEQLFSTDRGLYSTLIPRDII